MDVGKLKSGVSEDNIRVDLVPITPQLIMDEERARPKPSIPVELLAYQPPAYQIGPNDVLYVTVWDHPELTTPSGSQQQTAANGRVVRPNGELFYPFVGNIMVKGMTIGALTDKLTRDLSKYIDKPQVDVSVLSFESQKVTLSGAFKNTSPIKLTSTPISLVEAIGIGGVLDDQVDLTTVRLTRDGREYKLNMYALSRDSADIGKVYLKNRDNIHLTYNDNKKVMVMGEVAEQKAISFRADTVSLSDVLGTVGGLDKSAADGNAVYVIRGMQDLERQPAKVFQLNAKSASSYILASRFRLQPQDVVYVGSTRISRWNRVISELLPTALLLNSSTGSAADIHTINN
ncbi:MAG TPA: polysaccharide biosynthesis/export family protein [Pseudomonadales bacterium]|nr:polysaccharide biosynthesis/export family protein [Pseudomonadales bacterium]